MSNGIKFDLSSMFGKDFVTQKTTTKKNGKIKFDLNKFFGEDFKISKYTIEKVEDQEYDHISRDEFIEISGVDFGVPFFKEAREEIMQDR